MKCSPIDKKYKGSKIRKKVLIIVWNNFTHDKRVMNISDSLVNNEYKVTVIAAKEQKGLSLFEQKGYRIFRIPLFSSLYSLQNKFEINGLKQQGKKRYSIKSFLKNNRLRKMITAFLNWAGFNFGVLSKGLFLKPDIIHANDLDTLTVGYILSKLLKTKLIFDSHELWLLGNKYDHSSKLRKWWWRFIQKKLISEVDKLIVTTEYRGELLKKQYNLKNINVIHNCPKYVEVKKSDVLRQEYGIPTDNVILLYQGLLTEKRGIFAIVDAIKSIGKVITIFMGMGNDKKKLEEYIVEKQLEGRMFVKDAVAPNELQKYTSSADIGLQLLYNTDINHYSTISNKLLEYFMAGLAIVASDFPEINKIITENNNGIVVDPENKVQIRKAITKLVTNRDLLESFKLNSKNNRHKYTWEEEEKVLLRIFSEIS